eukprot:CAMPEP_0171744122 /NCGR_PEP_ID=MMETSP0991-20121206/37313_1 /TAXON_ID=483369 /ORGANISM="non described non described, Strain CCMP2098" /LENGTH=213 /DNA_ID=CAMNT_0012343215 /DNA_START=121 /DNA_END=762 /DNA_ORIENTATION=-
MAAASDLYRADGVRITHDPYAPGMAEKYGLPGDTDRDGFDPYADSVGAGIYGGSVQRDESTGEVLIGQQYQGHNPEPGPVYSGTGYSLMSKAVQQSPDAVRAVLADFPQLVREVTTGGATPLHVCGMSRQGQLSAAVLLEAGADVAAVDTYGFQPLHRMASNNLADGAKALLEAGADSNALTVGRFAGSSPLAVARQSRGRDVAEILERHGAR